MAVFLEMRSPLRRPRVSPASSSKRQVTQTETWTFPIVVFKIKARKFRTTVLKYGYYSYLKLKDKVKLRVRQDIRVWKVASASENKSQAERGRMRSGSSLHGQ